MNIIEFLSQVDSLAGSCTEEQLRYFVHESARMTPEANRDAFLRQLQEAAAASVATADGGSTQQSAEKVAASDHGEECAKIMEVLDGIEGSAYTIEKEINEEYDDWYDSLSDEFLYYDPDDIMEVVKNACSLAHRCVKEKDYESALALGMRLITLPISTSDEDTEELDIWSASEALEYELDLRTLMLDTMTAAYYASGERCQDIWLCLNSQERLSLEDLLQHTEEELPDFPGFLDTWIVFLGEMQESGLKLHELYQEALTMLTDREARISFVRQYAERLPAGYVILLEDSTIPEERRWSLGLEALEKIRRERQIRANIALDTAETGIRMGRSQEELETCWLEAFVSYPCAVNYLRAYLHSSDPKSCREKLDAVVAEYEKNAAEDSSRRYEWRSLSPMFQFLRGDAMNVLRTVVCSKDSWDWTSFAKESAYLFLAALYQDAPGTQIMRSVYSKAKASLSFEKEKYLRGVPQDAVQSLQSAQQLPEVLKLDDLDEDQLFLLCFRQWRAQTVSFSDSDAEEILGSLQRIVERKMDGTATRRLAHQYGEFAQLLAALGEVRESLGQAGAKQRILSHFAYLYGRRPNFLAELRNCGWNGR